MEYIEHRGITLPLVGFGTWCIGDNPDNRCKEVETMTDAVLNQKITLIDTAEMYGDGKSESVVADVIRKVGREKVFLVDKILPENAIAGKYEERVRRSLEILRCDYIDLYLLHWKSSVDLQSMVDSMERLVDLGLVKHWGVSNFDVDEMEELIKCRNGEHCFANQILYNVSARGVEYDMFEWCKEHDILLMAYSVLGDSPLYQNPILKSESLRKVATLHGVSPFNILLRFVLRGRNIIALFKTSSPAHLKDNLDNVWQGLSESDLCILEQDFPAPCEKEALKKI